MGRTTFLIAVDALIVAGQARADDAAPAKADPALVEFFEGKVRPVLEANCVNCHGPTKQKAGLRLDSRASLMKGGDSGPAIEVGRPEASRLIEAVNHSADLQMPPKGKLKEAEVAALSRWVREGAVWPEAIAEVRPSANASGPKITAEDRAFWAFRPVQDPPIPAVKDESWPKGSIDRFILAELEAKGFRPVDPADKRALIRRATFDLIGLPPSPEEVDAFLADDSPEAFAKVVDRLLASPHYGERWGRHWLDVARYGEDQAHTFQARMYPNGYKYRDWVVKALNDDMPYDRFVVEQIAGDLVEGPGRDDRLAALGFFALGPVYYGGAVYDELDDRVDTLSRGFLGLTVACARCHDHKFDPIPTADYYALAGVFSSTAYKEYPAAPPEVVAAYDKAQADIKGKTAEIAAYLREESKRWSASAAASESSRYLIGAWTLMNRRKAKPDLSTAEFARAEGLETLILDRWVPYLAPKADDKRPYLARWRKLVEGQDAKVDLSGDEAAKAEAAKVAGAFGDYVRTTLALRDALDAQKVAALANAADGSPPAPPVFAGPEADVVRELTSADGLFALPKDQVEKHLPADSKTALKAKKAELEKLKNNAPAMYPVVHSLAEGPESGQHEGLPPGQPRHARPGRPPAVPLGALQRRHARVLEGERPAGTGPGHRQPRQPADRPGDGQPGLGAPLRPGAGRHAEQLRQDGRAPEPSRPARSPGPPVRRRGLVAQAVASGDHALGHLPACRDRRPVERRGRPGNVYLWRANRRRLEVEAWRDAMLAVSGNLDPKLGGPSSDLASPENQPADLLRQGQPPQPRRPAPPLRLPRPQHHRATSGPSPPCRSSSSSC